MDLTQITVQDFQNFIDKKYDKNISCWTDGSSYHRSKNLTKLPFHIPCLSIDLNKFDLWKNLSNSGKYTEEQLMDYFTEMIRNKLPQYKGIPLCFYRTSLPKNNDEVLGYKII